MKKIKVQKNVGNLLDKLRKLYMNGTVIQNFLAFLNLQKVLGIFCSSEEIFNRKWSLGAPDQTEKKSASPPAPLFLFFDPVLVFSQTVEPNLQQYSCINRTHPSPQAFSARSILDSTVSCDVTERQRVKRERLGTRLNRTHPFNHQKRPTMFSAVRT